MVSSDQAYNCFQDSEIQNVVIVGAGPVGLVASLLLSKHRIQHMLVEQLSEPDEHPQAHFINCRSMEILRELDGLDQEVRSQSAPANEWRRFVYCTGLSDLPVVDQGGADSTNSLLGVVDHFAEPPVDEYSPVQVTHFPQHDFVRLLRRHVRGSQYCRFVEGHRADIREQPQHVTLRLTDGQTGRQQTVTAQIVIGADGAHSSIRTQAGIELVEEHPNLQHLINVHFFSPQLADHLKSHIPAMLYFVYSTAGVAVIVSHALSRGEFVAQIPFFPPHQRADDFNQSRCRELLEKLAGDHFDLDINSIRSWRMGTGYASRFRSKGGRCFLIGDAAHQVTPAGGFGMNTGIQDAHNLIWKLARIFSGDLNCGSDAGEELLDSYDAERKPVARLNAAISVWNFKQTLNVSGALGLHLPAANFLSRILAWIPGPTSVRRTLFQTGMQLGLKQIGWLKSENLIGRHRRHALNQIFQDAKRQTLQLLFPNQDLGFSYRNDRAADRIQPDGMDFDPFNFKPQLIVGGRMPHFRIIGKDDKRISVLDLPAQMAAEIGKPCYVLLAVLDGEGFRNVNDTELRDFQPVVRVNVGARPNAGPNTDFSICQNIPEGWPSSFTVLMRPDGHIAWLRLPASATSRLR